MTQPKMEQLWDDYRDGTLTSEQRAEFERLLQSSEPASALWKAESQWLEMLAKEGNAKPQALPEANGDFAAAVLARWEAPSRKGGAVLEQAEAPSRQGGAVLEQAEAPSRKGGAVLARIGWRRWAGVAVSVAAAVLLALTLSMWSTWFGSGGAPVAPGPDVANNNNPAPQPPVAPVTPPLPAAPDAIGVLFASAGDTYAAAAAQPAKIRQALSDTASMFDVAKLATLLDPDVPDPARFVQPSPPPRG